MNMSRKRPLETCLEFFTLKYKLAKLIKSGDVLKLLKEKVAVAHELFKRTTFFLRAFFVERKLVPGLDLSVVKLCMNAVSQKDGRGKKPKDSFGLEDEMKVFWKNRFSLIYHELIDFKGSSFLKQIIAEQILDAVQVDCRTNFRKRFRQYVLHLLGTKDVDARLKAGKIVHDVFSLDWNSVPESLRDALRTVLPVGVEKSVYYDLKNSPCKYLNCTLQMCVLMEGKEPGFKPSFMPTRRGNIPCHCKFDTESLSQILIPYKERVDARKLLVDRTLYNEWVWEKFLDIRAVSKKLKGYNFHHEITTDGISASILFSRPTRFGRETKRRRGCKSEAEEENCPLSSQVGVDPGRRNIITAVDREGRKLRYTSSQRAFESKLLRYREVLEKEKEKNGIVQKEAELSRHCHKTVDPSAYFQYLLTKSRIDAETREFYLQEKWRSWRFRIFCNKRSSEDRLCNTISKTFGSASIIHYGNWSTSTQLRGCAPTPNKTMRLILQRKFHVHDVDEFRTSKICSTCMEELRRYKKRGGRLSYSRLFCLTCSSRTGRPVFVDRDFNAAANILLAGTSPTRPPALSRSNSQASTASLEKGKKSELETEESKSNKLPVDAGRSSSDPTSIHRDVKES